MPLHQLALKFFIILLFIINIGYLDAQTTKLVDGETIPEAAIRSDLKHLYETLQASHYDLYVHQPRNAYDKCYLDTQKAISGSMSQLEVVRLFMPLVAFGKIGHARIDFPIPNYVAYVRSTGTLLPFDIRVEGEHTFVTHSYTSEIKSGVEVLSINNKPIAEWIEHLGKYVSAERPYMAHAQLETYFPRLLWLDQGQLDSFDVSFRQHDNSVIKIKLNAMNALDVEQQKSVWESALHEPKAEVLKNNVAYLRPGPFYATGDDKNIDTFKTFINDAFIQFTDANASDLILDLRNNPGGDSSFSDPMIAWFAKRAFRFASGYSLKTSIETQRVLAEVAAKDPQGISSQMLKAMKQHKLGDQFAFEIPTTEPNKKSTFSGRVWVLVNRHSYSNATVVAAIIQDYKFGVVLGEETSDLPTSYASSAKFTLPQTGIEVTYPKGYFVRPSGDKTLSGVVPDHIIESPLVISKEDSVLTEATNYILSQRKP